MSLLISCLSQFSAQTSWKYFLVRNFHVYLSLVNKLFIISCESISTWISVCLSLVRDSPMSLKNERKLFLTLNAIFQCKIVMICSLVLNSSSSASLLQNVMQKLSGTHILLSILLKAKSVHTQFCPKNLIFDCINFSASDNVTSKALLFCVF